MRLNHAFTLTFYNIKHSNYLVYGPSTPLLRCHISQVLTRIYVTCRHPSPHLPNKAAKLQTVFDLETFIKTVSYFGLFGIVFAETGLLVGFFLPGDTLLITAGLLAAQGIVTLPGVMLACGLGALIGDSVGYVLGYRFGPLVFSRPENRFLDPKHIDRANAFFKKYGAVSFIIARFIPVVRTVAPTLAGVSRIPYRIFIIYSFLAAAIWAIGLPLLGFYLGQLFGAEKLEKYIYLIIGFGVGVSVLGAGFEFFRSRRHAKRTLTPGVVKTPINED
jgi:membrane-associated protein